jgi:tetratricopeptide (TPR) repeat protein
VSHAVNPYVPGGSVGNSAAFVGRGEVIAEIEQGLRRPGRFVMMVEGPRGAGKTSLLDELAVRLPERGSFPAVRFDVAPRANFTMSRTLTDLAETIAQVCRLPRPDLGQYPEGRFSDSWLPGVLSLLGDEGRLVLLIDVYDVVHDAKSNLARAGLLPHLAGLVEEFGDRLGLVLARPQLQEKGNQGVLRYFTGPQRRRIPPLSPRETRALVRLSDLDGSLTWSPDALDRVVALSGGHPYQVQLLCHRVWEEVRRRVPGDGVPRATVEAVETAVPETLVDAGDAFEATLDALSPVCRVVAAALARTDGPVAEDAVSDALHRFGITVVTRSLEEAPHDLRRLGLLLPDGPWQFRGELLPRWIREHKPLTAVQADLDLVHPVADNAYRSALSLWRTKTQGSLDDEARRVEHTLKQLKHCLDLNPNHAGAVELKADVLLSQGDEDQALVLLERLSSWQPAIARPKMVPILLRRAEAATDEGTRGLLLERLLEVAPGQRDAEKALLEMRLRAAREQEANGRLDLARSLFEEAGASDEVERLSSRMTARAIDEAVTEIERLEREERFPEALKAATSARDRLPAGGFGDHVRRLEKAARLATTYHQALGALQQGDRRGAARLLGEVVGVKHDYEDAPRFLYQAVYGVDPADAANDRGAVVPAWALAAAVLASVGLGSVVVADRLGGGDADAPDVTTMALSQAPDGPAGDAPSGTGADAAPAEPTAGTVAAAPAPAQLDTAPVVASAPVAAPPAPAPAPAPAPVAAPAPQPVVATARKRASNPTALVAQGWRHVDEGDLGAAYDTFDHATRNAPFDGAAWFGLGYAAEARGDIPDATKHYCKALDRAAGEVDLVREIQGRLRDLSRGCR